MHWPSPDRAKDLIRRYATLLDALHAEFGARRLVLPNGKYFPDVFTEDEHGVNTLLHRMLQHAGMQDVPMQVEVLGDPVILGSSCSSGGCSAPVLSTSGSQLIDQEGDWLLQLDARTIGHPVGLTTLLAHNIAAAFVEETRSERWQPEAPSGVTIELVATGLGFGGLLMEGAYVYAKSCGGPSVSQLTQLSVGELALAVGLFSASHTESLKPARKALSSTQAALIREAQDWLAGNPQLVSQLREQPFSLLDGHFELQEPKTHPFAFLGFGRNAEKAAELPALAESPWSAKDNELKLAPKRPKTRSQADDDLSALVAEALSHE